MMSQRFFAVVFKKDKSGYVLDYYPEERAACLESEGKNIIGDFGTREEADAAIDKALSENK